MAKYQVAVESGVQVPGQGIKLMDEVFEADESYVPSRFLVPLDEEAFTLIKKAKESYVKGLKARKAKLLPPHNLLSPLEEEELLHVPAVPKAPKPKDEKPQFDEPVTLKEMGEGKKSPPSKRAADQ